MPYLLSLYYLEHVCLPRAVSFSRRRFLFQLGADSEIYQIYQFWNSKHKSDYNSDEKVSCDWVILRPNNGTTCQMCQQTFGM